MTTDLLNFDINEAQKLILCLLFYYYCNQDDRFEIHNKLLYT